MPLTYGVKINERRYSRIENEDPPLRSAKRRSIKFGMQKKDTNKGYHVTDKFVPKKS